MSQQYQTDFNDSEIEIDLKKVYLALKKGIKWLIITPVVFGVIAIIYVLFIAKPVYTSEAKILLVGDNSNQSSLLGIANQFGFSFPSNNSTGDKYLTIDTLPEILKSRTLTKTILFSEFTIEKYDQPKTLYSIIFKPSKIAQIDSNKLIMAGNNYIAEDVLKAKQIKNTNIFNLYSNSPDPLLSKQIITKVISALQIMQSDFNKNELRNKKDFIIDRLQAVQDDLYIAEAKLKYFRERNLQINLSPSLLLEQERLEREIDIQTEIYISLKQQLEQIKINENKSFPSMKIIDEPSLPFKMSKPKKRLIVILSGLIGFTLGCSISAYKFYE